VPSAPGGGKERYGPNNNQPQKMQLGGYHGQRNEQIDLDMNINIDVEPNQSHGDSSIEERVRASQRRNLRPQPGDDFDNIDVNLDTDINNLDKSNQQKQIAIAGEIAVGQNLELDDEYLQDVEIPIDDGEDDMISDNYENFDDQRRSMQRDKDQVKTPRSQDMEADSSIGDDEIAELEDSQPREELKQSALSDNVISMDHSDDIE